MPIVPPSYGQRGSGTGTGGLSRDQVLSLIRGNATEFTFGNAFPGSPLTGALHYITADNVTIAAKTTDGTAITEGFNGNLFRYDGGDWRFIYNFRSIIEVLIALYSIYAGEFAVRTAYAANKIVTDSNDIFWTISAVADTNTTAPASNSSFVQLNGGDGGTPGSGITAEQFLAAMPDYLKIANVEASPPYFDPNNILDEYRFHIITIRNAFPTATHIRATLTSQNIAGDVVSIQGIEAVPTIPLADAQRSVLKTYLETHTRVDVNITFGYLQNNLFVEVYNHDFYIPRAEVLPYESQIITFESFPAFLDPENLPTRFGAQIVTLPDSFYEVTDLVFAINGIAGSEFVFDTSDTRPYVDLDATQLASLKSLLSSLDELGIWVEFRDKDDDAVYVKQSVISKQGIDIPDLREDVKQLQSHTGQSTLQPTLRLHTPTRGKVMPAVFLEDELFVLESDSNASEEVNQFVPDYRRDTTGTFPLDIDGIITANLGGRLSQPMGSSDDGMFAERRISALVQINSRKIKIVSPATLFDAASITGETTELRLSMPGYQHLVYTLQPSTFESDGAATRTLNSVVYNIYETKEDPAQGVIGAVIQSTDLDGNPAKISVQFVQEVSGVKQFLTGDTAPWATGNVHTAGLYMGDANGLPFEVEINRKPNVLLAWDESRAYAPLVLPENYTSYNELFLVVEKAKNAFDVFIPISALSADIAGDGHGPQGGARLIWSVSTRTISRVDGNRFDRIAYAELR